MGGASDVYIVGKSPIGGPQFGVLETIISQYATGPIISSLVETFGEAIDQSADVDAFYNYLWNIQTAQGYGLDVWGHIVFVKRTLQVNTRYLGFEEALPDFDPFNTSPFYSGQKINSSFDLSDDAFRQLIFAKALANITYGSIPGINAVLQLLFPGRGPCYVTDNGDMTMTYTFGFPLMPVEIAIVETSNVLPRPTGVAVKYSLV